MTPYSFMVSIHVVVAILGLGPLMTLAILTRGPAPGASRTLPPEPALRAFLRILRLSQVSLGVMFGTGATLMAMVHGAYGRQGWMIVSAALFLVVGGGTAVAQVCLKKALTPAGSVVHVERAHRTLIALCFIVGVIAWLMQTKPL